MTGIDIRQMDLLSLADCLRKKDVSPVELAKDCLDRIEALNDKTNAFITVTRELALKQAAQAEQEILKGDYKGPMHGMPYAAKDLFETKGVRTTCGSKILYENFPEKDAAVVDKLARAGAVLVGKTNMHEFAFGLTNHNPHYGHAKNPWDPERITGGSSGGSGAAVASGCVPMALGTDTGGSIRIPSSLCGLTGLKPTYGRVSKYGVYPLSWTLDHVGPMAKTAADAAAALNVLAGYDERDPGSIDKPVVDYVKALETDLKGMVIGLVDSLFFEMMDPQVKALVEATKERFQELGAKVVSVSVPDLDKAAQATLLILSSEAASALSGHHRKNPDKLGADVKSRLDAGALHLATHYIDAMRWRRKTQEGFARAFEQVDLLLTPGSSITAPMIKDATVELEENDVPVGVALTRCTRIFNLMGLPSLVMPCGFDQKGLPAAVQLAGRPFDEARVLAAGHAYQKSCFKVENWPEL
jgi:aspartyl-tRNA(Asn)/glutamyl-tRNA(Gln) amidotransferase subunit A